MTSPRESLACPWCGHETTDGSGFRTHLMVEHRKSDLAAYVLDAERSETDDTGDSSAVAGSDREPDHEPEAELLAR